MKRPTTVVWHHTCFAYAEELLLLFTTYTIATHLNQLCQAAGTNWSNRGEQMEVYVSTTGGRLPYSTRAHPRGASINYLPLFQVNSSRSLDSVLAQKVKVQDAICTGHDEKETHVVKKSALLTLKTDPRRSEVYIYIHRIQSECVERRFLSSQASAPPSRDSDKVGGDLCIARLHTFHAR